MLKHHNLRKEILLCCITLFALTLNAQQSVNLLELIQSKNANIKKIEGNLVENDYLHNGKTHHYDGKVYYDSNSKVALLYDNGDKIVVNGEKICLDHGMFHGTFNVKRNKTMRMMQQMLLLSFQGRCQELADAFNYTISTQTKENDYLVILDTKNKKLLSFTHLVFHYRKTDFRLEKMELTASNGDVDVYDINDAKYNGKVDASVFEL